MSRFATVATILEELIVKPDNPHTRWRFIGLVGNYDLETGVIQVFEPEPLLKNKLNSEMNPHIMLHSKSTPDQVKQLIAGKEDANLPRETLMINVNISALLNENGIKGWSPENQGTAVEIYGDWDSSTQEISALWARPIDNQVVFSKRLFDVIMLRTLLAKDIEDKSSLSASHGR